MARQITRTAARTATVLFLAAATAGIAGTAQGQAGSRPRFAAQPAFAVHAGADPGRQALVLTDVNGDTRPDLVAIAPQQEQLEVFINDGSGGFGTPQEVALGDVVPVALAVADVTSPLASPAAGAPDGVVDILVGGTLGELLLCPGAGDGTFVADREPLTNFDASRNIGIVAAQLDGQPGTDVALLDATGVIALCNTAGTLAPCGEDGPLLVGDDSIEMVSGDFNGDTRADLAVLDRTQQRVRGYLGNGDGSFVAGTPVNVAGEASGGLAIDITVTRADDDAIDDLVVANRHEFLQFLGVTLLGTTRGSFRSLAFVLDFDATALAVGDFDDSRDGIVDVITSYAGPSRGGLTTNLGEAGGSFADPFIPVGSSPVGASALLLSGDLDGDNIVDLLAVGDDGGHARVLLNATVPFCAGDCNGNGVVSIDELTRGIGIVLGERDVRDCIALDVDMTSTIVINEVIAAVGRALDGCPTE